MLVYVNGKFVPEEQATVSIFDHGFLYGDGVFEGIRAYNGRVFRLMEHVDRLFDSAKAIDLIPPVTKDEMAEIIKETLRRNNLKMLTSVRSSVVVSDRWASTLTTVKNRRSSVQHLNGVRCMATCMKKV